MTKVLIFEGVDKAGKSTTAEKLAQDWGYKIVKGLAVKTPTGMEQACKALLKEVGDYIRADVPGVIIDRIHIMSDAIYNPVHRDPSAANAQAAYQIVYSNMEELLKRTLADTEVYAFIFTADADIILKRMEAGGGPEDIQEEDVKRNVERYLDAYANLYTALITGVEPYNTTLKQTVLVDTTKISFEKVVEAVKDILKGVENNNTISVESLLKDDRLLFAPIVPKGFKIKSDFALVLAQNLVRNKKQKKYWREFTGYKVLDNGAFELGKSIELSTLLDIAKAINADELVLPDVFRDMDETIKRTEEAILVIDKYKEKGLIRPDLKLMAVPQGKDLYEWLTCFDTFLKNPKIDVIAINRDSARFYGSRLKTLEHVYAGIIAVSPDIVKEYHLLGMQDNIHEAKEVSEKFGWVRSMDSCFPYLIAREYCKNKNEVVNAMEAGIERSNIKETINFNAPYNASIEDCLRRVRRVMRKWNINI